MSNLALACAKHAQPLRLIQILETLFRYSTHVFRCGQSILSGLSVELSFAD